MTSSPRTEHATTLPGVSRRETVGRMLAAVSGRLLVRLGLCRGHEGTEEAPAKKRCRKLSATCSGGEQADFAAADARAAQLAAMVIP